MARLAYELRGLREQAGGPTYREMARRTGLGASTLSQAADGHRLPSPAVLRAYVRACGADEAQTAEWERRRRRAAREEVAERSACDGTAAPCRGLERFGTGDGTLFFGRERLVAELRRLLCSRRLVAVVGASGCGKSSLVRAGLVPALRAEDAPGRPAGIRVFTPGPRPSTHAELLAPVEGPGDTVVVVDQFEEVFTLCADREERASFLDLVAEAARPGRRLRLVIVVRADFVGRCGEHRRLTRALAEAAVPVGPMSPAELREAITKPAAAHGDHTIRLWDTRADRAVDTLQGPALPGALAFSSDGTHLVTTGGDDIPRIWDLDPDRVAAEICAAYAADDSGQTPADLPPDIPC